MVPTAECELDPCRPIHGRMPLGIAVTVIMGPFLFPDSHRPYVTRPSGTKYSALVWGLQGPEQGAAESPEGSLAGLLQDRC